MFIIEKVEESKTKQEIASIVLNDLKEWFGLPDSTNEYIKNVADNTFFAAYHNNRPIGFFSLREENKKVLDLYVLGVLQEFHNRGIGHLLQVQAEKFAIDNNYNFLMVLTLAEKANSSCYSRTREFYLKEGFVDLYQNDDIFDSFNPCQIMIKTLEE